MVTRMRTTRFASKQTRRRRGGWEERGEDNKKLRLLLGSSVRGSDTAALGGAPTTLRTEPEAPCEVTGGGGAASTAAYGRLAGCPRKAAAAVWAPLLGQDGGHAPVAAPRAPCRFPPFSSGSRRAARRVRGAKGGRNLPPRAGGLRRAGGVGRPLPWAVGLQRAAASVCLFRVLRSAPSPPAQTSLRGREKRQCAGAALATLPVPCCHEAAAILGRSRHRLLTPSEGVQI